MCRILLYRLIASHLINTRLTEEHHPNSIRCCRCFFFVRIISCLLSSFEYRKKIMTLIIELLILRVHVRHVAQICADCCRLVYSVRINQKHHYSNHIYNSHSIAFVVVAFFSYSFLDKANLFWSSYRSDESIDSFVECVWNQRRMKCWTIIGIKTFIAS